MQKDLWEKKGIDYEKDSSGVSLSERADIDFVNDLRFWAAKYYQLSNMIGVNAGFFTY